MAGADEAGRGCLAGPLFAAAVLFDLDRLTLADRLDETAEEVATARGAMIVDTNDPFWADQSTMADDGIHPNAAGYTQLAALWMEVIEPIL